VNHLGPVNIQTKHIARVVTSFISAATPLNIVKSFELSGFSLIGDDQVLLCQVSPATGSRLFRPIAPEFPQMDESDQATPDEDDGEEQLFAEEYARLLFDLDSD
jgi:hypothetical protein